MSQPHVPGEEPVGDERALLEVMRDFKRLMFFDRLIERGYVKVWPSGYELTQAGRDALSPPPKGG